eukprot:97546-Chlamydomonas_euryale.AAC.2
MRGRVLRCKPRPLAATGGEAGHSRCEAACCSAARPATPQQSGSQPERHDVMRRRLVQRASPAVADRSRGRGLAKLYASQASRSWRSARICGRLLCKGALRSRGATSGGAAQGVPGRGLQARVAITPIRERSKHPRQQNSTSEPPLVGS